MDYAKPITRVKESVGIIRTLLRDGIVQYAGETVTIENFDLWYRVLGTQRHCKVAGIFLRLLLRDGKPHYLNHIPRVMTLLESGLEGHTMQPRRQWLNDWLPERLKPFPNVRVERARSLINIPK